MLRLALVLLVALTLPLAAQQGRGTILGTVTDSSGATVPSASVLIVNTGTNANFQTQANAEGFYTVPGLPIGDYSVTAEMQGFKKTVRTGITLQVDQKAQVDLVLQIGGVTESVEVTGEAPLVDASSATVGKVVDSRRISDLPVNGRSAFALMMVAPGVKPTAGPTTSGFADRGQQLSQVSINGGPTSLNSFVVDGGNNNQSYYPDINANPAVDAVEEFKVQSNTMSAEYGFTLGGVVNVVTKGGTNAYHGTAYEFVRNSAFDARNTFSTTKNPFTYNQYGGSFGGPVRIPKLYNGKDRTFFFANWEQYKYARGASSITRVPTPLERQGDFSQTRTNTGSLYTIYDPASTLPSPTGSGYVRTAFPNNVIPANRLDPVALKAMSYIALPNRTPDTPFTNDNNFYNATKSYTNMNQYTLRGDQRISDRNNLMARFSAFAHEIPPSKGGIVPPELGVRVDNFKTYNFLLNDTHTFTPTVLNDFRLSIARQHFTFLNATYQQGWPQKLGLPADFPSYTSPVFAGIPGWDGDRSTGVRAALTWQFVEALTVIRGGHTMKMGGDFRLLRGNNTQLGNPSGTFNFGQGLTQNPQATPGTGSTYATFLLGAVANANITAYLGQGQKGYSASGFFQDDWKFNRRLTLNLGLRYDYQSPPIEMNLGNSNFDPFGTNPQTGLPGRTTYAGIDYGDTALQPYHNAWSPRFGFAYDVTGKGSTVIRGGYAIFFGSIFNVMYFGNTQGFASTNTSYQPANNNSFYSAFRLQDGFPSAPLAPQGSKLGPSPWLSTGVSWDQSNQSAPMSQQWNATLQQRLGRGWMIDVTYTANHGTHLMSGGYDYNQMDPKYLSLGKSLQNTVTNPYAGRIPGTLGGKTITLQQSLRPYPYIAGISVRNPSMGNSIYHAGLISVQKRFSGGLTVLGSFTGGKLISDSVSVPLNWFGDQVSENSFQSGLYNRRNERSVDPTDVSQRLVISGIYELPFGKGKRFSPGNRIANTLVTGWQVNTITTAQTGLPLTVRGASNYLADRPNSTGVSAKLDNPTIDRWFNTDAFVNPPDYTYGNVGRTIPDVRGPGLLQIDLSAIKDTWVHEGVKMQFRAEAFNMPNRVNYGLPNDSFSAGANGKNASATFGTVRSARDARIIQFGLKFVF